jgi:hypothetical protein
MQPLYTDLLDNKVTEAAKNALDTGMVEFALAFVPKGRELEVIEAFEKSLKVRKRGPVSQDLADHYFFDIVLRIHRTRWHRAARSGASILDFTELDRIADDAIATGYPEELSKWLCSALGKEIAGKLGIIAELEQDKNDGVEKGRSFAAAMLAFKEWTFQLYEKTKSPMPEIIEEAESSPDAIAFPTTPVENP